MNSCSTGLASSLEANLRAKPCGTLCATDVSPNAARGCEALWLAPCGMAAAKGKRLYGSSGTNRSLQARCATRVERLQILLWSSTGSQSSRIEFATRNTSMSQNWRVSSTFSCVLHLAACMPKKQLVLVESRVVLDPVSKGRSGSRWFGLRHRGVIMLNSVKSCAVQSPLQRMRRKPTSNPGREARETSFMWSKMSATRCRLIGPKTLEARQARGPAKSCLWSSSRSSPVAAFCFLFCGTS